MQTISTAWGASGLRCEKFLVILQRLHFIVDVILIVLCTNWKFKPGIFERKCWFWELFCETTRIISRHKHMILTDPIKLFAKGFRKLQLFILVDLQISSLFYRNYKGLATRLKRWSMKKQFWFMCATSLNQKNIRVRCTYSLIVRSFWTHHVCYAPYLWNTVRTRNFVHIQENLAYSWRFWLKAVMISHFQGHVMRDSIF